MKQTGEEEAYDRGFCQGLSNRYTFEHIDAIDMAREEGPPKEPMTKEETDAFYTGLMDGFQEGPYKR